MPRSVELVIDMSPSSNVAERTIGVVIVTYNSAKHIDQLATSLRSALADLPHHVVVVDNASTDDTVTRVRDAGVCVIEMDHNAGYSAGINAGLSSLGDVSAVLVLNPDITVDQHAVAEMLAALHDPSVGVVVPQNRLYNGELSFVQRRDPSLLRALASTVLGANRASRWPKLSEVVQDAEAYAQVRDVDWGVGAVMMISRACLDAVGPWDESFFLYSEEIDYCQRVRRSGRRVRYVPSAVIFHEGGGGAHNPRLRTMMTINKVRLYARHHNRVAAWAFFAASWLYEASRGIAGSAAARAAAVALIRPSRRPPEIKCCASFLPS
ncbi:MAG TPA: glycosyltransferase family 2 protein [Ilumatobacteraceae bacterium]